MKIILVLTLVSLTDLIQAQSTNVTITELIPNNSDYFSQGNSINNNGEISGFQYTYDQFGNTKETATLWLDNTSTNRSQINYEDTDYNTQVIGADNYGDFIIQLSARESQTSPQNKAYKLDIYGDLTEINPFPNGTESKVTGLNDNGIIVGNVKQNDTWQATLWNTPTISSKLQNPEGWQQSHIEKLNLNNEASGWCNSNNVEQACIWKDIWTDTPPTILPILSDGSSQARSINDSTKIVGWTTTQTGEIHATIWTTNKITDLGTVTGDTASWANDINNNNLIVGASQLDMFSNTKATLFLKTNNIDLNTLIPPQISGWELLEAKGINNNNQIIVNGLFYGVPRAAILTLTTNTTTAPIITSITKKQSQGKTELTINTFSSVGISSINLVDTNNFVIGTVFNTVATFLLTNITEAKIVVSDILGNQAQKSINAIIDQTPTIYSISRNLNQISLSIQGQLTNTKIQYSTSGKTWFDLDEPTQTTMQFPDNGSMTIFRILTTTDPIKIQLYNLAALFNTTNKTNTISFQCSSPHTTFQKSQDLINWTTTGKSGYTFNEDIGKDPVFYRAKR